ncbi:YbaK/EbsC family protein [Celeribacter sp.]|uniref:YbaK/EbsC family protein n=1 Tax=Celeribacter sp. TaxID=1890673 RepID=UPI003A8CA406
MSKSLKRVKSALEAAGAEVHVLEMDGETRTAAQAAEQAGCQLDQIAKSIIFQGEASGTIYLFVTAGGNQVDVEKASALTGEPLGRADGKTVRAVTGFAIGGVSPVGHLSPPHSYFDPRLLEFGAVWAAAGTPRHVFEIAPDLLCKLAEAQTADFTA